MVDRVSGLREVDRVEIVSLMDNSIDFLSTTKRRESQNVRHWLNKRRSKEWVRKHFRFPFAEHGFSVIVHTFIDGERHRVLFDTGVSADGVTINAKRMGIDLSKIEAIVLSHGHYDHWGGLQKIAEAVDKNQLPVLIHDDMLKTRGVANSAHHVREMLPFPPENLVQPAKYVKTKKPHLLAGDTILVTGEIPRVTDFEKGYLQHKALVNGEWQPDPLILDDRAIVVKVKQKGLIVLSGCAHAGIVNTVLYARQITQVKNVHAVLGGFHLAGKEFEERINQTVEALKDINPRIVVPSHCTGWRAIHAVAGALPEAFIANSVGNMYQF